jgi:hypothetical protein
LPDITPLDFSVWGYVINKVFAPPLPARWEEIQAQITESVQPLKWARFIGFGMKSLTDGTSAV